MGCDVSQSSPDFATPHPLLRRIEALQKGKLSTNEITILAQDMIDAGEVMNWGKNVFDIVSHCVVQNLCTLPPKSQYVWRVTQ
jgi:hypothetical protein